jgi:hypothetical protein
MEGPAMKQLLLAVLVFGIAHTLTAQTETSRVTPPFQPAEARSVTDIRYNPCGVPGIVVLYALISESGEVQEVEVRRNIACLTQIAVQAVKGWKFSPATFAGKAIASRIPVAVTFESQSSAPNPFPLPKPVPQTAAAVQAEFQPVEVTRAGLPPFHPGYAFAEGTVALEVTVGAKGEVEVIKVLRDIPPFTANAKAVVGDWQFMPATFNGRPVPSKILLAFVSPPFVTNGP